jgi:N-acyl-D-aspartate/D-glutamate deacylase
VSGELRRGFDLADVVRWMATNTADQIGLTDRGRIAVGAVADLVVFAPDEEFTVDVARLHHKNAVTAYGKLGGPSRFNVDRQKQRIRTPQHPLRRCGRHTVQ